MDATEAIAIASSSFFSFPLAITVRIPLEHPRARAQRNGKSLNFIGDNFDGERTQPKLNFRAKPFGSALLFFSVWCVDLCDGDAPCEQCLS